MSRGEEMDTAGTLADLWSAEMCEWVVRYDPPPFGNPPWHVPWVCELTWTDTHNQIHDADSASYAWQFDGDTADEAMAEAVKWCERLAAYERSESPEGVS